MKTKNKITQPTPELAAKYAEACPYEWCEEDGRHTCVPADVNDVARYAATVVREENTLDGSEFEAKIYKDGVVVLGVYNEGWGGPHQYFGKDEEFAEFVAAARRAYPTYEYKYDYTDALTEFLVGVGEIA